MRLNLYRLVTHDSDETFVAAQSSAKAVELYVASQLDDDRQVPDFDFERIDLKLTGDQRLGLDDMLASGLAGVATFDVLFGGWSATLTASHRERS